MKICTKMLQTRSGNQIHPIKMWDEVEEVVEVVEVVEEKKSQANMYIKWNKMKM